MEQKELAIHVDRVSKVYKLYRRNRDRLIESLGLTKKKLSTPHYALKDVSLDIYKGETVGIIGTNGSGKSTILKIITGVLHETERHCAGKQGEFPPCWSGRRHLTWNTTASKIFI